MIMVTLAWQSQSWYPILLKMTIKNSMLLSDHPKVSRCTEGQINHLIQNLSLRLLAWLASDKIYLQKEYQKGLSTLSQMPKEQLPSQIANRPPESGLVT